MSNTLEPYRPSLLHRLGIIEKKRRKHLFQHVDLSMRGLEIGAFEQPTVLTEEAKITSTCRRGRH